MLGTVVKKATVGQWLSWASMPRIPEKFIELRSWALPTELVLAARTELCDSGNNLWKVLQEILKGSCVCLTLRAQGSRVRVTTCSLLSLPFAFTLGEASFFFFLILFLSTAPFSYFLNVQTFIRMKSESSCKNGGQKRLHEEHGVEKGR
jgi:hypothetical protein